MQLGLTKVKLLGELGRIFGREWDLLIKTPAEAIAALTANLGDRFVQYLYQSEEDGIAYRVVTDDPVGIDQDKLQFPCDHLIIAPQISGRGGGFGRVLLGSALLVGSFFMPASVGLFGLAISSTTVGLLGASLILGGIHQMLSPVPKTPKRGETSDSFLFDNAGEIGYQGLPVPVGYGRRIITDLPVVSVGITIEEIPA